MNEIELNVFTCCDDNYVDFIPLFVVSNLSNIENCFVEVGVKTDNDYTIQNIKSLLDKIYPNKFTIYKLDKQVNCASETLRFINQPTINSKYVYISDIDIVTLESNIVETHLNLMKKHSLPYSNIIRDNSNRLTGLHFTPYENYYPIESYDNLNQFLQYDEVFLYHLMNKRFPNITNTNKIRPVHGIHMSPNRDPYDEKVGWRLEAEWKKMGWLKLIDSDNFRFILPHLSDRLKWGINLINEYYSGKLICT